MKFKITINESTVSYLTSKSGELIAKILNANYKSGTGVEYTIDGKKYSIGKISYERKHEKVWREQDQQSIAKGDHDGNFVVTLSNWE